MVIFERGDMMKRIAEQIVKKRVLILILAVVLLIPSVIGFAATGVNYDILTYLPAELDSMKGQEILDKDFHSASMALITVENMERKNVNRIAEEIREIDGVKEAMWIGDFLDTIPSQLLPEDLVGMLDNGNCQLMMVTFEEGNGSDRTLNAMSELKKVMNEQMFIGGLSAVIEDTKLLIEQELPLYIAVAVGLCLAVLLMGIRYSVAPFIFMIQIAFAVLYNFGTNVFLGQISYITQALAAILQLAVSMDFSIFLLERYDEECDKGLSNEEAMKEAIVNTFSAVSGSSLTTIAGFLAMCTMDLSLGKDMGIVMAKGVVLGVLAAVILLPALILVFDKPIHKHQHRVLIPQLNKLGGWLTKHYKAVLIAAVLLLVPFSKAQNNNDVYYNLLDALPSDLVSTQGTQKLRDEFNMPTTNFILVDKDLSSTQMQEVISEIENTDGITAVVTLDKFVGAGIPEAFLPSSLRETFQSGNTKMILANSEYDSATDKQNNQITELEEKVKAIDPSALVTGEGALNRDLVLIADHDFEVVNIVSILAVFVIIAIVFKSLSVPLVLVAAIELAITINMGIPYFLGQKIPFIASIVIGTIQLGATIDYAILMTTRYKEERNNGYSVQEAVRIASRTCSSSIMTSGFSFFAATVGVAMISRIDLIRSLCGMLARGVIISMITILVVLPALLMAFGRIMEKTSYHFIEKKKGGN